MDTIPNNDYASTSSQTHLGGASYISGRDLFTHFANLTNQDRPKSKSPNPHASTNSNNNSASTTCADIYSAILSSQQQGVIDETSVAFSSPTRHLSEPSTAGARHSPIVDHMERTPRSCRTSPSVPIKSFHQHLQRPSPPHSLDSSPHNGLESSQHQSNANPSPSVFSLSQSGLQELMRKSGNVISTEEIKKANNSSQLYLLVPSNYPVIMAVGEREKAAATATVNEATARNLLERFQLTSAPTPQQQQSVPSPQMALDQQSQQQQQSQSQQKQTVVLRAPRKNSTNIPPMLLQSLKGVVPSLAFRDILEGGGGGSSTPGSGNKGGSGGGGGGSTATAANPLPHLASIALAYGFPSANDHQPTSAPSSCVNSTEERKKPNDPTATLLISPPQASQAPSSASASSSFLLEDYRSSGGPPDVKIKPPLSSSSTSTPVQSVEAGLCVEGLLGTDSNGSLFFSNDSPPTRNYMGRMGGGGVGSGAVSGGSQSNQSGGDSKDIRRRVSHNEVERRRRDRINTWIAELYKLLPPEQQAKSQYQSKGVVLKRVCEYFQNCDSILKALRDENAIYKQEICRLTQENHILRDSLKAHFQQQQQSAAMTTTVSTPSDISKAPSPSKRSHFSTD